MENPTFVRAPITGALNNLMTVAKAPGFIPSQQGPANGFVAPNAGNGCSDGYDHGNSPFRHEACHDPRRFAIASFDLLADGAGRLSFNGLSERTLFTAGVGETDAAAGWTDFGVRTYADTNVEKGGYLVPPGFEGLVGAIGFAPAGVLVKPTVASTFEHPATGAVEIEALVWPLLMRAISARLEYWETTNRAKRYLGNLERWPVADQIGHSDLASNGLPGSFGRLQPMQYHVPTLGPAERRGDEVADRLSVVLTAERQILTGAGAVALPAGASIRVLVRVELAVGLMTDVTVAKNAEQDTQLAEMQRTIDELKAKIDGRAR